MNNMLIIQKLDISLKNKKREKGIPWINFQDNFLTLDKIDELM